jgi:putative endonuclease
LANVKVPNSMKQFSTYILSNRPWGRLYVGVTSNLLGRLYKHKNKVYPKSYTASCGIDKLVWYELHDNIWSAIQREKQIKNWNRDWKINLIEEENPEWKDLSAEWFD